MVNDIGIDLHIICINTDIDYIIRIDKYKIINKQVRNSRYNIIFSNDKLNLVGRLES